MSDWLTDLKFQQQISGGKLEVACNPDDADRVRTAVEQAGIADLVEIVGSYVIPPGHAFAPGKRDLPDDFYLALQIRRYL